jgi:hypothetical protein
MRDSPDENLARLSSVLVTTSLLGVVRLVEGVTEEIVHLSHSWFLSLGENLNSLVGLAMVASSMSRLRWKHRFEDLVLMGAPGLRSSGWPGTIKWRTFLESVVIVGLPRGGDSKSTLDMQTASDESCFRPPKTRAAHAASLRLCLLSLVLLKPTNKLVVNVIDAT